MVRRRLCTLTRCLAPPRGYGAVAQLVAHHTGSVGVRGSSPLSSTLGVLLKHGATSIPPSKTSMPPNEIGPPPLAETVLLPF